MARRSRSASPRTLSQLSNPQMWWYVDGADATCAELAQRGVQIGEQPHDLPFGRVFSFHDPAGNTLYMLELR